MSASSRWASSCANIPRSRTLGRNTNSSWPIERRQAADWALGPLLNADRKDSRLGASSKSSDWKAPDLDAPGLSRDAAADLMSRAHEMCPYSRATRGNVDVTLTVGGTAIERQAA